MEDVILTISPTCRVLSRFKLSPPRDAQRGLQGCQELKLRVLTFHILWKYQYTWLSGPRFVPFLGQFEAYGLANDCSRGRTNPVSSARCSTSLRENLNGAGKPKARFSFIQNELSHTYLKPHSINHAIRDVVPHPVGPMTRAACPLLETTAPLISIALGAVECFLVLKCSNASTIFSTAYPVRLFQQLTQLRRSKKRHLDLGQRLKRREIVDIATSIEKAPKKWILLKVYRQLAQALHHIPPISVFLCSFSFPAQSS